MPKRCCDGARQGQTRERGAKERGGSADSCWQRRQKYSSAVYCTQQGNVCWVLFRKCSPVRCSSAKHASIPALSPPTFSSFLPETRTELSVSSVATRPHPHTCNNTHTHTQTHAHTHTNTQTQTHTQKHTHTHKHKHRHTSWALSAAR